jgi:hypothetical protein
MVFMRHPFKRTSSAVESGMQMQVLAGAENTYMPGANFTFICKQINNTGKSHITRGPEQRTSDDVSCTRRDSWQAVLLVTRQNSID